MLVPLLIGGRLCHSSEHSSQAAEEQTWQEQGPNLDNVVEVFGLHIKCSG